MASQICGLWTEVITVTRSTAETVQLGREIGRLLGPGNVVTMIGELGSGKTHLIKGIAAGMGVKRSAGLSSPSFALIQAYCGRIPFYHIDVYRLASEGEAEQLGLHEYMGGEGVAVIEWADRIPSLLPKELLEIHLRYLGQHRRQIHIHGEGLQMQGLIKQLEKQTRQARDNRPTTYHS